jgi:hypothetical protein
MIGAEISVFFVDFVVKFCGMDRLGEATRG